MPALFSSNTEATFTNFGIQLDSDQVLLLGDSYEAEDAVLKGKVTFNTTTSIRVQAVRLTLVGEYHAAFSNISNNSYYVQQQGRFHKQELVLFSSVEAGSSLKPGKYSWPFEFVIKGHQLETIQGLPDTFFSYRLKAVVERGTFAKDHKTYKPVRVVRTYEPTSVALNQSISVDKVWPDKVKYTFSTNSKAVVFGSIIPCELTLVPLTKGLKIGKIMITLFEEHEYHMKPDANLLVPKHPYTREQEIQADVYQVPSDAESMDIDGLEGYVFTRQIQLPRALSACRLSADPVLPHESIVQPYPLVRIRHSLRFVVALINADGHVSEIRARLPVCLFLTPNQRLDTKHRLMNSGVIPMTNNSDLIASEFGAPPSYGQHEGDETLDAGALSSGDGLVAPNGYLSSRASFTNVQDLRADAQLSANTLHNRLNSLVNPASSRFATAEDVDRHDILPRVLADSNGTSPANANSRDYFHHSRHGSDEQSRSRHDSDSVTPPRLPSGSQTPAHIEYDTTALSRVPSYNTASRCAPPRTMSYAGLPTYNEAASRPPSPLRSGSLSSDTNSEHANQSGQTSGGGERTRRVHYANGTRD